MKSAIIKNKKVVIENIEKPALNSKGAIIKVIGCGLCGSDLVKLFENKEKSLLGHEVTGIIEEINSQTNFKKGDTVTLAHHIPCGACSYCMHGNESMCHKFKTTNINPGGFSEYIFVSEDHLNNTVFKIPADKIIHFSFLEPLACCLRSIRRTNLLKGDKCLVIGLGSIGLLMAQALKYYCNETYGSDLIKQRLNLGENLGIKPLNDEGEFDAIFMTSGASATIKPALNLIRDGGKITVFSSVKNQDGYANNEIYYRELNVMGSYSPALLDLKEAYKLLDENLINTDNFSTTYKLQCIQTAVDDTINNKILKAYIQI